MADFETDPAQAAEMKKKRTFRTFSFRGIELEKLLDLSNEEFVDVVHARARRRFQRGLKRKPMGLIKKLRKVCCWTNYMPRRTRMLTYTRAHHHH